MQRDATNQFLTMLYNIAKPRHSLTEGYDSSTSSDHLNNSSTMRTLSNRSSGFFMDGGIYVSKQKLIEKRALKIFQTLGNKLRFSYIELVVLVQIYMALNDNSLADTLGEQPFISFMFETMRIRNRIILMRLVTIYFHKVKNELVIKMPAFVTIMNRLLRSNFNEKVKHIFEILDSDSDGLVFVSEDFRPYIQLHGGAANFNAESYTVMSANLTAYLITKMDDRSIVDFVEFKTACLDSPWIVLSLLPAFPPQEVFELFENVFFGMLSKGGFNRLSRFSNSTATTLIPSSPPQIESSDPMHS